MHQNHWYLGFHPTGVFIQRSQIHLNLAGIEIWSQPVYGKFLDPCATEKNIDIRFKKNAGEGLIETPLQATFNLALLSIQASPSRLKKTNLDIRKT